MNFDNESLSSLSSPSLSFDPLFYTIKDIINVLCIYCLEFGTMSLEEGDGDRRVTPSRFQLNEPPLTILYFIIDLIEMYSLN